MEIKRGWELLSEEQKSRAVKELIDYFHNERDEDIGIIAAENILDHFMQGSGKDIYNKGVEDTKKYFLSGIEDIGIDIDSLMRN